jgi:type I restriction enzyme S subunit
MYPIDTELNVSFLMYAMLSWSFVEQVAAITSNRVKMPKINQEELSQIWIAVPGDLRTQSMIEAYLNRKCGEINAIIAEKHALLYDLEMYKRSLIYEAVTGKRKVV